MRQLVAAIFIFFLPALEAEAAGFELLKPHRAVYDVELENAEDRSGINGMNGRIVYETRGNACEGITISYRFVTRIDTGSEQFITDQQSASYESPDGNEFSFSTKSFVNDQQDQDIKGSAKRTKDGLKVRIEGDDARELRLVDGYFVSSHLVSVLESAEKGEAFVSHEVFDGSGDADKVLRSTSVIGKSRRIAELRNGEAEEAVGQLLQREAWPVTMSYFENNPDNSGEALPIYEASFLLYPNGVTRDLTMRYPDYVLKATLSELEYFEVDDCS